MINTSNRGSMAVSMNSITIRSAKFGSPPGAFNPVTFWSGYQGGFWDFTNPAGLFSDTALTTPATVDGLVRGVTDLSGLNQPMRSSFNIVTAFPFTMKSGYCIADQGGGMATQPISIGTPYTAIALVRSNSVTTTQNLVDTDYVSSNRVAQNIVFTTGSVMQSLIFGFTPFANTMPSPTLVTNTDYYASVGVDTTGADLRIGGSTYTSGSGSFSGGVAPVAVAASFGNTASPQYQIFDGRIYCAAYITKKCTPEEIEEIGNYMNTLAGTSATV